LSDAPHILHRKEFRSPNTIPGKRFVFCSPELNGDYPAVDTEPEIVLASVHHGQEEKAATDSDR
jgi:hypothetical protein